MRFLLLTAILAVLAGCATNVTKEQWQNADYGEKLDNAVYVARIQQSLKESLIDPDSLRISCADAKKAGLKILLVNAYDSAGLCIAKLMRRINLEAMQAPGIIFICLKKKKS